VAAAWRPAPRRADSTPPAATIGGITPPVGSLLFVACSIGRIGLSEASPAIWPFVIALVLVNALLIVFPGLTKIVPKPFFE